MPVTKSAKKALRTATRRHEENLLQRTAFKQAIKTVKKAVAGGSKEITTLFSDVQSKLDKAAKNHTIHKNKAARLKSRLSKKMAVEMAAAPVEVKKAAPKAVAKAKKPANKKK